MRRNLLLVCLLTAIAPAAMLSFAYYAEHQLGLRPCILCLYQRPPHYVAAIAGVIALVFLGGARNLSRAMLALAGAAFLVGAGVAIYHAGVEWKFWPGPASCGGALAVMPGSVDGLASQLETEKIVACDQPSWIFLGLSMAAWNALISLGLAAIAFQGAFRRNESMSAS